MWRAKNFVVGNRKSVTCCKKRQLRVANAFLVFTDDWTEEMMCVRTQFILRWICLKNEHGRRLTFNCFFSFFISSTSSKHVFVGISDFGARRNTLETLHFRFNFPQPTNKGLTCVIGPIPLAQKVVKYLRFTRGGEVEMLKFPFDPHIW